MIKWIKILLLRRKLKKLNEQELILNDERDILVYKPTRSEILPKLDKCSEIHKKLKRIIKKKEKIYKKLDRLTIQ